MIHINHRFTSLTDWIYQSRSKKGGGWANKTKQDETFIAYLAFKGIKIETPCKLIFTWYIPNKNNDLDNISASGRKFIIDGMRKAKTIKEDNLNNIVALEDRYIKGDWGVKIEWESVK